MVIVKLTERQWETVYTALRIERARLQNDDPDLLKSVDGAIEAVRKWEEVE